MAISLSNAHFSPQDSTGYFVYALRRDDDDMLHFTKVSTASTTETFDPFRLDGTQVEEFGDYDDMSKRQPNRRHSPITHKINISRYALIGET